MTQTCNCDWCSAALTEQRWITLWPEPKGEVHCCSKECLLMWLAVGRALRF